MLDMNMSLTLKMIKRPGLSTRLAARRYPRQPYGAQDRYLEVVAAKSRMLCGYQEVRLSDLKHVHFLNA